MSRAWSLQERSRAIQWRNHGRTPEFIAQRLGRSADDVDALLGTTERGTAKKIEPRKCLKCCNPFTPRHAGLHLCDPCKAANAAMAPCSWPSGDGCRLSGRRSK